MSRAVVTGRLYLALVAFGAAWWLRAHVEAIWMANAAAVTAAVELVRR